MKFATPFLLLTALAFSACNTLVRRTDLYSPARATGPYSESLETGRWKNGEYRKTKVVNPTAPAVAPAVLPPAQ